MVNLMEIEKMEKKTRIRIVFPFALAEIKVEMTFENGLF